MLSGRLLFTLFLSLCAWKYAEADSKTIVGDAIWKFNMRFFKYVLEQEVGNMLISPLNIYTSLAMLQQGAKGTSRLQLNKLLRADGYHTRNLLHRVILNYKNTTVEFANKMFVQRGLNVQPRYRGMIEKDFFSDIDDVDFSADNVNSWIANNTHSRITQLLSPQHLSSDLRLLLLSTIYLKTEWAIEFDKNLTASSAFSTKPGVSLNVPTLRSQSVLLAGENRKQGFKWVQIPLKDNRLSVVLILPNEINGLNDLMRRFPSRAIGHLLALGHRQNVNLSLPKLKLRTQLDYIPTLRKLGLTTVFQRAAANLKGISRDPLHVSAAVFEGEFEVDEGGVTASAASGLGAAATSRTYQSSNLTFHADHPFALFVMDHVNNLPLFSGKIVDPTKL